MRVQVGYSAECRNTVQGAKYTLRGQLFGEGVVRESDWPNAPSEFIMVVLVGGERCSLVTYQNTSPKPYQAIEIG